MTHLDADLAAERLQMCMFCGWVMSRWRRGYHHCLWCGARCDEDGLTWWR
jgi:hypothetical protein